MARWKVRVEFLLSVIELLFLSLTVEVLQAKCVKILCLQEGVGHLEPRFQEETKTTKPTGYTDGFLLPKHTSGILMHPAVWPQKKWARNWEGAPPLFGEVVAGSPSNTKSPGLRPTYMPSAILIHPAVWPQ